jgi:hypothetical protein
MPRSNKVVVFLSAYVAPTVFVIVGVLAIIAGLIR